MPSPRITPILSLLLILLATTPAMADLGVLSRPLPRMDEEPAPSRNDASGREILILDPQRDVQLQPDGPAHPIDPIVDALDITRVTAFGETGQSIRVHVKVRDLEAARNYRDEVSGGISLYVCFQIGGTDLAAHFRFRRDLKPIINLLGIPKSCSTAGVEFLQLYGAGLHYVVNPLDSQVEFLLDRRQLSSLREGPPLAGDRLTNLWVIVRDDVHNPSYRATRWDAAPDKGPSTDALKLRLPTANFGIQMLPDNPGRPYRTCEGSLYLPSFEVEADGSRTVPVRVSNFDLVDRRVRLEVEREGGFSWQTRILPNVTLPPAGAVSPGNATLNTIVWTPPGTAHNSCATLHVRATDAEDPNRMGEVSMNVFAVMTPSPARNQYFLHTAGEDRIWLSPDPRDRDDERRPYYLPGYPNRQLIRTVGFNIIDATISAASDAPTVYDLVLNTTASGGYAQVALRLRSENFTARAAFGVYLVTDGTSSEILGSTSRTIQLSDTPLTYDFDVPIEFTRDSAADGDPSRIVSGRDKVRLFVSYQPLSFDENVDNVKLAGQVSLLPEGSTVTLPIWAAIKRNVNQPGESGAFITLRGPGETMAFANPGKPRSFNFTVQNEGSGTDLAVLSASLTGPTKANWTVRFDPPGPFELEPGLSQDFRATLTPGNDLPESTAVLLEIAATSQSDITAVGVIAIRVVATSAEIFDSESLDAAAENPAHKGKVPGPASFVVLLAAVAAAWFSRRQESPRR